MKQYVYFVSYFYSTYNGKYGIGNSEITMSSPINSIDQIREIESGLKGYLLNYILLREEEINEEQ